MAYYFLLHILNHLHRKEEVGSLSACLHQWVSDGVLAALKTLELASDDLSWSKQVDVMHTSNLHLLQSLVRFSMSPNALTNYDRCTKNHPDWYSNSNEGNDIEIDSVGQPSIILKLTTSTKIHHQAASTWWIFAMHVHIFNTHQKTTCSNTK